MTTCPTCGAQNDPGNRFCDQCGTRLDAPAAADKNTVPPDQPTMAAPACPNCGAMVLPGEAFCDNCGADLTAMPTPAAAPAAADAPTMLATPPAPAPAGANVPCPNCGQMNLPGEAFCDNCGASLAAPAPAAAAAPEPAPAQPDDATVVAAPEPAAAPEAPAQPDDTTAAAPEPAAAPEAPAQPDDTTAAAPEPTATGDDAGAARKAELEAEIGRQQQIIAQFEQMQSMFGAATPPAVTAGLDEARANLARAQADLDALATAAPAVDSEAVKQIEAEIGRQQQIIAQFEQMQSMFGAATPPAVTAGLDEARTNLARAQADLAALTGGAPATPSAPAAPSAPATPAAPAATTPAPQTAPIAAPRLVIADGGQALNLPTDKAEIIIGREDPVSNIFPEVDLTSFGGEAGGVSRQHAKITHSGSQWMLTDLNSTNFTRIDGVRLEPYVDTPLHDGARVQFGRVVATFKIA